MELRVLDLFSGAGGFSHALRSIATTVAYCEISAECRKVLKANMRKARLERAPVFEDITKLGGADVRHLYPTMITAGFPCQDISVANPDGAGLKGVKSGLFKEVLRLIDELPNIQVVFLENSSAILIKGFDEVRKQMMARGFSIRYCTLQARQVGALHKRTRWYCMCWRHTLCSPSELPSIATRCIKSKWCNVHTCQRMLRIKSKEHKQSTLSRCRMMGNAIVPQCAMHAWNGLITSAKLHEYSTRGARWKKGTCVAVNVPAFMISSPCNLLLSDGERQVRKELWATPTHTVWHAYRSLTNRSLTVFSNQLYYEVGTVLEEGPGADKRLFSHMYVANPEFVELLMGYPKRWTLS